MSQWFEVEKQVYMGVFRRLPVVLVRGEGARVWDENGKSYLDLVGGIAVNVLGHNHPRLTEAICSQAKNLIHTSNLYYTLPQLELGQLLMQHSCCDKVFFCNSGAEANEGALKLARRYGRKQRDGAFQVVTAESSFHGRTLATVAATGQPKYQAPFAPMPEGFAMVPFNDIEALSAAIGPQTAAIMLEPIQGESGVHLGQWGYLRSVKRLCEQHGLLLIFDEIQTGMGRTGKLFAYEHFDVEPDVITLAKGLAGGVPIGAILCKDAAMAFEVGDHGSTFGGNPLACAAGVATLRTLLEDGLIENSARLGQYFLDGLERLKGRHPVIQTTRGLGLLFACDFEREIAADVVKSGLSRGLILNNTGPKTLRFAPPLIITPAEADEALELLSASLDEVMAAA
ncbi:MAG: acetylornithine transaminase [Chloroflexi bacterium]|nr:acetylornithine transaminase [Chloroflexota bacterium]